MSPSSGTYVLDTHALLYWLLEKDQLPSKVRKILSLPSNRFCISTASVLEIEYLIEIGRVEAEIGELLSYIQSQPAFSLQPFDELVLLETLDASEHRDPFDRIILGTAKAYKMPIITRDRWMKQQYKNTIW
jgi:PIN domain nuclease of toxin-antitoxin system